MSGLDEVLLKAVLSRPPLPCALDRESASGGRMCREGDRLLNAFP